MEDPRFARSARYRRILAFSLAILLHLLLLAGLAYLGADGLAGNGGTALELVESPQP